MTTPPSPVSPQSTSPLQQHQQHATNHGSGNTKIVAGYALQQRLGSGSFATVYRGVKVASAHGQTHCSSTVAVKAITRSSEKLTKKVLENLEMEISILRTYRHPNIVCLHDVQKTERHFYLILEFCAGGDVQRLIRTRKTGRITERLTRRLVRDLSAGLKFLWGQELIHRDIKPQNLLLTGPLPLDEIHDVSKNALDEDMRHKVDFPSSKFALKIADFGFARHLQTQSLAETLCGSPLYMAPEILQHQRYDAKADIWSVGTVVFEMIAGRPPFHGENHIDLLRNIQRKAVRLPPDVRVSKECVNLLRMLLNRNPLSRAGFKEFFEAADAFVALGCEGAALAVDGQETCQPPSGMELGTIAETGETSIHGTESMATIATVAMPQHTTEFRSRQSPKDQTPSRLASNSLQQTEHHNNQHRKISPSPYTPAQQIPYEDNSGSSSDKSNIAIKPVTPPFGPITVTSQPPLPTSRDYSNADYNHDDRHDVANGPRQYPHFVPLEPSPPGPTATKTLGQTNTAFPPPLSLGSAGGLAVRQPAPLVPRLNTGQQQLLPPESSYCVMARSPFQQTTAQQYEMKDQHRHRRTGSSQNSDDSEFVIVEHGSNNSSGSLSPSASKARLSVPGNKQGHIQQQRTQALIWNQSQSGQRKLGTGFRLAPSPPASPIRNPEFSEGNVAVAGTQRVSGGVQQTANPRLIKGMLSTSPGTGGALVGMMEAHSIGGVGGGGNIIGSASGNLQPGSSLSTVEAAAKILAAAEDVGRRAVNVAHLGDTRAYVAMRLMMSEGSSSLLSTTPMEGVEEEDADNGCTDSEFTSATNIPVAATGRRRTISADHCGNATRGQTEEKHDDDDDDEMPFAVSPPDMVPIPSSPSTSFRPSEPASQSMNLLTSKANVREPLSSIQSHFREALSCYLKALSMIKSAVNAARTVHAELSRSSPPTQQSLENNGPNSMLLERCQVSLRWLKAQFAGVLERADAANGEVGKVQSSDSNESMDNLQLVSVEELVYTHALTCGRDGAVKQLLGQHEAARACYRSAGLLAETLLMEPKLGEDDRKVLEDYVHGFAERITELDDIMFERSRHGGSTVGSRRGSGVIGLVGPSNGSAICVIASAEKHYV